LKYFYHFEENEICSNLLVFELEFSNHLRYFHILKICFVTFVDVRGHLFMINYFELNFVIHIDF
jgi:hypothetical protein